SGSASKMVASLAKAFSYSSSVVIIIPLHDSGLFLILNPISEGHVKFILVFVKVTDKIFRQGQVFIDFIIIMCCGTKYEGFHFMQPETNRYFFNFHFGNLHICFSVEVPDPDVIVA